MIPNFSSQNLSHLKILEFEIVLKSMKKINFEIEPSHGLKNGLLTPHYMKRYCIFEEKLLWD